MGLMAFPVCGHRWGIVVLFAKGHAAKMASRDIHSVLAVPNFRWLWIGSLGSSFAMNMQIIARGWFVYDLTSSAMDLAWVTLSFMLPSVLFSSTVAYWQTACQSAG